MLRVHAFVQHVLRDTLARSTRRVGLTTLLSVAAASALAACGGGDASTAPVSTPPASVANVEIAPAVAPILVGRTMPLTATARDAQGRALTGRTITWSSGSSEIARVDANGVVTGVAPGTSAITATSETRSATVNVTVSAPSPAAVGSVRITSAATAVRAGETMNLVAVVQDADGGVLTGRDVAWTTSAPAIATVHATSGVVTGVAAGAATITATSEGKSATFALTVTPAPQPVARVVIDASPDTIEAYGGTIMTAVLYDANNGVLVNRTVGWTSSNPAVATIDAATGAITGVDRGTVTVTATSEGKSSSRSVVVVIKYRSLTTGSQHACDIASGGIVWCWGLNGTEGRLGSGTPGANVFSATPVRLNTTHRFESVSTYGNTTCGLTRDGQAFCWGSNASYALGNASNVGSSVTPVAVSGGHVFQKISVGADHACAITVVGRLYCWGGNGDGQLGTGNRSLAMTPVAAGTNPVTGISLLFSSVTAGSGFTCGIGSAGGGYCWGANGLGQLGDGVQPSMGNTYTLTPTAIVGGHNWRSLSATSQIACGILSTGGALCWGRGDGQRLGTGTTSPSSTPLAVSGGQAYRTIAAGFGAVCAADNANAVWCWGLGNNGQLGQNLINGSALPVRVGGGLLASEVSAANVAGGSGSYACAISADRLTTYCWGRNDLGQLGNGTTSSNVAVNATPSVVQGQRPL